MTQLITIDRATLEQLVRMLEQCLDDAIQVQCDLEQGYSKSLALAQMVQVELSKEALTAGRAAIANAEPADTDDALMREALYALEYAADMTKPEGLSGCDCPICTSTIALQKRLGEKI